jgi:cell division transport system ATP-binding protein
MSTDSAPTVEPAAQPLVRFDQVGLARVLDAVSFAIAPGSFHLLTGPARAGKSSLLRLMALAEPPGEGLVQVFGRDVATLRPPERRAVRRRIGAALEPAVFLSHLSVWDNVALGPRITRRRRGAYEVEVGEVIKWMGLAEVANASPDSLGVGERHRLAIARALANRPELLLIDTPGEGLDEADLRRSTRLLDGLARSSGMACILATREGAPVGRQWPRLDLHQGRLTLSDPLA